MHQAEKYAQEIVRALSHKGYLNEFMQKKKDQEAVKDIAASLKRMEGNLLVPQRLHLRGYSVPLGSLALYHYMREELALLKQAFDEKNAAWADLTDLQRENMEQRFRIVNERQQELADSLIRRNVADQVEKRVDAAKAYEALRDDGFIPLHLDEITMGRIFNTLAMQAFLDRFNLIFQGIAEPVNSDISDKILKEVFAPFWKQYHDGLLFLMNDGSGKPPDADTAKKILMRDAYCFSDTMKYRLPHLSMNEIKAHQTFFIGDVKITPIEVIHGKTPILGYRIDDFVYITDMKTAAESEIDYIKGARLLVLNALRFKPHPTHQSLDEAIVFANKTGVSPVYFTHMSHEIGLHEETSKGLPPGMFLAYDGLTLKI